MTRNRMAATTHQINAARERTLCASRFSYRGVAVAMALCVITGCATTGDLEKLKTELQGSVTASKQEVDRKLTPIAQSVEALKGETKAGLEDTKKQIEERERLLAQDLKAQQEALKKIDTLVGATQAGLAELNGKIEALAKDNAELRAAMRSSTRSVRDLLKVQETTYQEALRSIRELLNDLGPPDEKPK
jgi:chromosome segregation ATPase